VDETRHFLSFYGFLLCQLMVVVTGNCNELQRSDIKTANFGHFEITLSANETTLFDN